MDAAAELGRNPVSKHQIQLEYGEMSRLTRDGTAEPVSRDQILRHARGQGNIIFPCSADHEQDWQPYPVDPYSAICDDNTYIHTYIYMDFWGQELEQEDREDHQRRYLQQKPEVQDDTGFHLKVDEEP